jgi:hypothetical protein
MSCEEVTTLPLPADRTILRRLWLETTDQRIRFYQSFLFDEIKGRPAHSLNLLNNRDAGELRQKIMQSDRDGIAPPGFAITTQQYWKPHKGRARPGMYGMVEQYLSHDQKCRLAAAFDRIHQARRSLVDVVYRPNRFRAKQGLDLGERLAADSRVSLLGWQRAVQDQHDAIREIIHVYQEFADVVKARLDSQTNPARPQPVVKLQGIAQQPIVNGVPLKVLTEPRYRVVQALVAAGPDGLSKAELERTNANAVRYLRELKELPGWNPVIIMAGKAWSRYSIKHE